MAVLKRLDQTLSNLGYCSRREVRIWLRDKRVRVAGELTKNAALKVDPASVTVDDKPLDHPGDILIMLNKPLGYVCTHDINEGQRIYDLLPEIWLGRSPQVVSVGRLDKDTTGLILITDQSALVQKLTSPKQHVNKVYRVTVDKPLDQTIIEQFATGVQLISETEPCLPATLEIIDTHTAKVTLNEGKYHQVRRMFAACDNHVVTLHREQFGHYTLGDLAPGEWRDLI
ncbi:pseudouridine synthase [Paraglaciecola hydrolytica]|uniref:Pseudouridine synthase n=1 Tax=Paraglaciecola hydrolytica TaxID=1799789 RepID=A0A136A3N0_9ALTE|nr:pseudouridine synthase [Paraglaciecola hydrolytica]KXI29832.1 16S rRNA pseudouridine(516) synthase [Paraglaciecola hydrolytica]